MQGMNTNYLKRETIQIKLKDGLYESRTHDLTVVSTMPWGNGPFDTNLEQIKSFHAMTVQKLLEKIN